MVGTGIIPNSGISNKILAVQVSNMVRRIEQGADTDKSVNCSFRTGTDHDLSTASILDVVKIPKALLSKK